MGILNRVIFNKNKVDSDEECYQNAILLIKNRRFGDAYKIICQWNIRKGRHAIGSDWGEELKRGLNTNEAQDFGELYLNFSDVNLVSNAIYVILSGLKCGDIAKYLCHDSLDDVDSITDKLKYIVSFHSTIREINQLSAYEEKYVVFCAALDENTCPICGELDGKRIKITDGKIGKNIPPLHEGCRCTLVSGVTAKELKSTKRRHRNPQTHKSELIPYMTYSRWKKKYMN